MCTYNGSRFLASQLDSFLCQERLPDQLVVCDDGSQDGTREILMAFARTAPFPVEVRFNAQRLGISRNFDQALAACTGEFIALSDQDDVWHPSKLRRLVELLELNPSAGYACSDAELMGDDGRALGGRLWDHLRVSPIALLRQGCEGTGRDLILKGNCVTGATMVVRKSLYPYLAPIPVTWVHDHWLVVLSEILGYHGVATSDLLTRYRLHHGQACGVPDIGPFQLLKRLSATARQQAREVRQQRTRDLREHLQTRLLPVFPDAARWLPIVDQVPGYADKVRGYAQRWWRTRWSRFKRRWLRGDEQRAA